MSNTLAIKPTRREIIKIILDAAKKRKLTECAEIDKKWREAHATAAKANERIQGIALDYANKKYKTLLTKIKKLILAEFPNGKINFIVNLETVSDSTRVGGCREQFKPDGKVKAQLVVYDTESELDLPQEVRNQMVATKEESDRLRKKSDEMYTAAQRLRQEAHEYGHADYTAYQKLLERVVPTLGGEATSHLDALIGMVVKALEVPAEPVNESVKV